MWLTHFSPCSQPHLSLILMSKAWVSVPNPHGCEQMVRKHRAVALTVEDWFHFTCFFTLTAVFSSKTLERVSPLTWLISSPVGQLLRVLDLSFQLPPWGAGPILLPFSSSFFSHTFFLHEDFLALSESWKICQNSAGFLWIMAQVDASSVFVGVGELPATPPSSSGPDVTCW